jgi:hypothetical protein
MTSNHDWSFLTSYPIAPDIAGRERLAHSYGMPVWSVRLGLPDGLFSISTQVHGLGLETFSPPGTLREPEADARPRPGSSGLEDYQR